MKKGIFMFLLGCAATFFVACSEDNDPKEEFPNWQETNETYFNSLYSQASQRIAAGDNSWRILRKWSLQDDVPTTNSDFIIAHVVENGEGTVSPKFTDSVLVAYSGRLLPSLSYPTGYIFDNSYIGEFHPETARARGFRISGLTDGFSTALQNMHEGDRWEIYVPAALGYGTSDYTEAKIPGHSVLIFDLMLSKICK
ncbi:MAG: FKBP-type peptidyl-prolyl cis-trans isomerase [Prevotella sp.]|nr:FKBP-type peptidyl-prolyl cis-trans isomerase [Prevotella sp.]